MNADSLKAIQAPLKDRYRAEPESARCTMSVTGHIQPGLICRLETGCGAVDAGLHPAAGGNGDEACSGDMLLQSLVACAGVTLSAVATAMNITLESATLTAEGDMDFRGTLGVDRTVPVGIQAIRLNFDIRSNATTEQLEKLIQLTERYCVIFQTLRNPPAISVSLAGSAGA